MEKCISPSAAVGCTTRETCKLEGVDTSRRGLAAFITGAGTQRGE